MPIDPRFAVNDVVMYECQARGLRVGIVQEPSPLSAARIDRLVEGRERVWCTWREPDGRWSRVQWKDSNDGVEPHPEPDRIWAEYTAWRLTR